MTLSTRTLASPPILEWERKLTPVLRAVEAGHLRHVNMASGDALNSRVYRRLVTALD